jgi:hypothetical protein
MGRTADPCLNVPASSVPSAFNAPANELGITLFTRATLVPFCVTTSGTSSSPSSRLITRAVAVPSLRPLGFGIWSVGFTYAYIPRIFVTVPTRWMATM